MAWTVLVTDDLNDYSAGAKVNALRTAALAAGQSDPFPRVMADVVARVRAQVGSCRTNQLSATANSIPPDLKTQTCWLIIEAMQARLPGLRLTEEEKGMVTDAKEYLEKVASCDFAVSDPVDPLVPTSLQTGGGIEVANAPTRVASRTKLDGL